MDAADREPTGNYQTGNPRPLALSVAQAAEAAGVSRSILYEEMRRTGGLKYVKIGARRLILVDDLRAWLVANRVA